MPQYPLVLVKMRAHEIFAWAGLESSQSAFRRARIKDVSYHAWLPFKFLKEYN
jgi:hypothetical protein